MAKIIYTDVDQTLLNFNEALEVYIREMHDPELPVGCLEGQSTLVTALGYPTELANNIIYDFFDTHHFGKLPPLNDAVEHVQALYRDGWEFVAISACPPSAGADIRRQNLVEVFGIPFADVHLTGFHIDKRDILTGITDRTVWVEDHVINASIGHELGYRTFLMDQKHNWGAETPAQRVTSWSEIAEALKDY